MNVYKYKIIKRDGLEDDLTEFETLHDHSTSVGLQKVLEDAAQNELDFGLHPLNLNGPFYFCSA